VDIIEDRIGETVAYCPYIFDHNRQISLAITDQILHIVFVVFKIAQGLDRFPVVLLLIDQRKIIGL
jgi:hypothetical protein